MPRRSKSLQVVLEECQRFAGQLPLDRRASLYRGLAEVCGNQKNAVGYISLAKECDALRKHEAEMQLDLSIEGDGE
jgi:hypothetical protein